MQTRPPQKPYVLISNLVLFALLHLVLVMGLLAAFSSFVATLGGVLAGMAAYALWRFKPPFWRDARVGPVLGLTSVLLYNILGYMAVPPPPPPLMQISEHADGSWRLNRGGGQLVGSVYVVLPDDAEVATAPAIIGSAKVIDSYGNDETKIEWLALRKSFEGRKAYMVRPLRPKEVAPTQRELATLISVKEGGRVEIDVGSRKNVEVGELYALFGPGEQGKQGYVVIDTVDKATSSGYLVQATSPLPAPPIVLERVGLSKRFRDLTFTKGEAAALRNDKAAAEKAFQLVLDLSGGTDERARKRLEALRDAPNAETATATQEGTGTSTTAPR